MSLEPICELMEHAQKNGYAIGYFESWNIESLQGVIDAAEKSRSPVIIGFNGEFLCNSRRHAEEQLSWYGALGRAAGKSAKVPCGVIFNECPNDEWVLNAVTAGFNLVMPVAGQSEFNEYQKKVQDLVEYAHAHGVAVETEIDELPLGSNGNAVQVNAALGTDPEIAAKFVEATNVDLLAVSVGNVHIKLNGRTGLDLDRLADIRSAVRVPLVLHGGTGITDESLQEAVKLGVAKVNFGTYLKQHYLAAVRRALGGDQANPHSLLGIGGHDDVLVAGRHAVRDAVLERIHLLGCCGKA